MCDPPLNKIPKIVLDVLIQTINDKYPEIHYDRLNMAYPAYVFRNIITPTYSTDALSHSWDVITNDNYMDLLKDSSVRR